MLLDAADRSEAEGQPFNRYVTILWENCELDPREATRATGDWIKAMGGWLHQRGGKLLWAWVQESGPRNGAHCHILYHMPPHLAPLEGRLGFRQAKRIVNRLGGNWMTRAIQTQKIHLADSISALPEAREAALTGKLHYMLKCAPARLEAKLGMVLRGPRPWGQSSLVYGKRLAIWQERLPRQPVKNG